MAIRLSQQQVEKIRADFPGLTINQIAAKHGVGWITVKKIVQPEAKSEAASTRPRPRAARNGKHDLTEQLVIAWWHGLTLEEKAKIMLEAL